MPQLSRFSSGLKTDGEKKKSNDGNDDDDEEEEEEEEEKGGEGGGGGGGGGERRSGEEKRRKEREEEEREEEERKEEAAEQLVGLPEEAAVMTSGQGNASSSGVDRLGSRKQLGWRDSSMPDSTPGGGVLGARGGDWEGGGRGGGGGGGGGGGEEEEEEEESDVFLLGKSYFDMKEYRRAAHALRGLPGKKAFFLRSYAMYLAGEKRKEEEAVEMAGPLGKSEVVNRELAALESELGRNYEQDQLDAFGMYLYGVVLHQRERKAEARMVLCASVNSYPLNWSTWAELQAICTEPETLPNLSLNEHWMKYFFLASVYLDLQKNKEGLHQYQLLLADFPRSEYILAQTATAQYNLRSFDEAQELFESLLGSDPYRIEGMDIYSNILYVKEAFSALSYLAHKAVLTDKYRPETCCIVGNYYSLKAQHQKAVLYFKRALKLNRQYLSAWTLMGHEYVEMKNTPAAIDAYRRAVDINPRDYRAWYGLGQTYEILGMPYYALYYYRRATQLRPHDPRMWCAMGQCYENEQLLMHDAAIRCYKRAVSNNDREGIALLKLAKLHEQLKQADAAAHYYRKWMDQTEGQDISEALLYLANYCKTKRLYEEATQYATRLLDYGGPKKEDAKPLLREIRSEQQHVPLSPLMEMETVSP
ncbi:hypothetical protein CBR_g45228 [Chara braunii]|uniref:Cdc23 domain-containing protein n=1 Tax=Chara braunii TaxID=69332 RepID=A0A388K388_CHABU|nr:hypothetical protein CBR_g45228 [Chara braunii]|eukprot:GBG64532.1 hypothetical protein CBR_g45228 [Chara braunii]